MSRRIRVLSVSDFYPPVIGGMERHVQTLSRELVRRGHHVAVATLGREGSPAQEVDQGVHVHRIAGFSRLLKPFYQSSDRPFHPTVPDPGVVLALNRVVRRERPQIIHARGWIVYSVLALKRWNPVPVVVTLHDYGLICSKRTFMYRDGICSGPAYLKCVRCAAEPMGFAKSLAVTSGLRLSYPLHNQVDRFIALNRGLAEASGGRLGTRGRPIQVIPSMVPDRVVEVARAASRPDFVPSEQDYLLYVGGVGHNKGFDVLLAAHAQLEHRIPLVVIATPPVHDLPKLPSDVTVVEGVEHDVVMGAWAHCLLGVVPSTWAEPFGQVAVEAMACGKAVVASAVGGLTDIVIPGETGLLVPAGDSQALRIALDQLVANPARREAMGSAGRTRASRFFASTVAAQVETVYLDVLADQELREADARTVS